MIPTLKRIKLDKDDETTLQFLKVWTVSWPLSDDQRCTNNPMDLACRFLLKFVIYLSLPKHTGEIQNHSSCCTG